MVAGNPSSWNRTELFEAVHAGWVAYDAVVQRLTDDLWLSLADDRGWTAKDHVANVTAWENIMTEVLRNGTRPEETLQLPSRSFDADPVAAFDAAIHRLTTGQSVRRATRNRSLTHARLIATLKDLDEPTLHRRFSDLAGIGGDATVMGFAGDFLPALYRSRQQAISALVDLETCPGLTIP